MPQRQVFVNGRHQWIDLGPGAAKHRHGDGPIRAAFGGAIGATRIGQLNPQGAVTAKNINKENRR